ncbi:hypothetical protein EII29_05700 [Leptotrichia sp. OH3620_COT-345]|nr:hypothetical protein EII29_05700 [Leptotrichia sp. OH3620_COT-345]
MKEKNKKTNEVTEKFEIRRNDFHNSENKNKENNDENKNNIRKNEKKENELQDQKGQSQVLNTGSEEADKKKSENQSLTEAEEIKKAEEQKKEQEAQKIQNDLLAQKKKEIEAVQKEKADKKEKENVVKRTAGRKYLQVATLQTEAAAKKVTAQLGGNFTVQAVKGTSGRTMYRVISVSTDNPQTLSAMEAQVRNKLGSSYKYIVRTVGKQ